MEHSETRSGTDRRAFLKNAAAASATLATTPWAVRTFGQGVHSGVQETLRIGLVGAGGRGTGAVVDAFQADPDTQLVGIADVFLDRARQSRDGLKRQEAIAARVQVPDEKLFADFNGYRQLIDSGVDVVILATPPHFRPDHLEYAVQAGKHCFVEKPIAVDVPGCDRVRRICAQAKDKNLSIVSGLCYRYDDPVVETVKRIQDGAIGDILAIESHYDTGTLWHRGDESQWSRMEYQIRNWLYYTWLSGDHIVEQGIHSLDKTAWLLHDISPLSASGTGGRQQRTEPEFGNIYDHHTVFYEYPQGVRVYFTCRQQANCTNYVDEHVIGTKGTAQILAHQIQPRNGSPWKYEGPPCNMYESEHRAFFRSIREGKPINNGDYMCNSTMLAILGRTCTYTGKTQKWETFCKGTEQLGPREYAWTSVPEPPVAIPGSTV